MLDRDAAVDGSLVSARRRLFDRQETAESNFSGISCNSGGTAEDLFLTVSRAPLSYYSSRRRGSLDGVDTRLLETSLCFDSEVDLEDKRMLDAHNIDTPSWLLPMGPNLTQDARYNGHSDILPDSVAMDPEMASCHPFGGATDSSAAITPHASRFIQARRYVGRRLVGHGHHKRHPSPIRRKEKDPNEDHDGGRESPPITVNITTSASYPDTFYPIFLPMDQAFKAKYIFSNKKGKTGKERTYLFLEHPCGWCCFLYHFIV